MTFRGTNEDQSGETSRGKIIALNYDAYNDLPGDTCLYCLTDRQQMILLALVEFVGWKTRWYSPSGATILKDTVEGYQADLAAALMTDRCEEIITKLDAIKDELDAIQNTVDDTGGTVTDLFLGQAAQDVTIAGIVADLTTLSVAVGVGFGAVAGIATIVTSIQGTVNEMSDDVDNIETIVTASATEITETGADVDNIELLQLKMKNQTSTIINNTVINLGLTLPNQTFTSDSIDKTAMQTFARYNALCSAIVSWVLLEGYALLDALAAGPSSLATLRAIIDADVFFYSYILTPGAPAFSETTILAAFVDSAAVDDVACALINYLANLAPTYANFAAAMDAYTPPALPDSRAVIHDALAVALDGLDAWTAFAPILESAYQQELALNPTSFNCLTCGPASPCGHQIWDFTVGEKGSWIFNRGIYVPGQGLVGVPVPGDTGYAFEANLYFPGGCLPTTTTYLHFSMAGLPQNQNGSFFLETYKLVAGVETLVQYVFYISSNAFPAPIVTSAEWSFGPLVNYQTLSRIRIVSNTFFNTPNGGNWIVPTYSALQKVEFNSTP
jgi:hypothetical protein